MRRKVSINTPIGLLDITLVENIVVEIAMGGVSDNSIKQNFSRYENIIANEIKEYFAMERMDFTFRYRMEGSDFCKTVWRELQKIPYGSTATYGEIARRIGRPGAARAVGMACNRNPLLLIIPCHRVLGSNGRLTGFACGLDVKRFLLELEYKSTNPV